MPVTKGIKRKADDGDGEYNIKKIKSAYSDVIDVKVGIDERRFIIHSDVICARSKMIAAAVSKGWREAEEKVVFVKEQDPSTFEAYLDAVHAGDDVREVASKLAARLAPQLGVEPGESNVLVLCALCKLWVLADFLQDLEFANIVSKIIWDKLMSNAVWDALQGYTSSQLEGAKVMAMALGFAWPSILDGSLLERLITTLTLKDARHLMTHKEQLPRECLEAWMKYSVENERLWWCIRTWDCIDRELFMLK